MNRTSHLTAVLSAALFLTGALVRQASGAEKRILANGLTVILEKDASSANTVLQILIKGGMRAEPSGKRGLAFLTTRLAVEIPDSRKAQELIGLATRFSVTAGGDSSLINIECLSVNLEPSVKVLSKIFLDPLFSGLRIDAVKKHMEHQSQVEEDDSVRLAHLAGLKGFFSGSGYGGSIYGDKDSLEAIKNKDVSEFYKSLFVGKNIIMCFASDLPDEAIVELVNRYFGGLPPGTAAGFGPLSPAPPERALRLERDTRQAYVGLAYLLPGISPRNFARASVLESLLGKGQGSRLWPLRAERKLAYNVNCRVAQMRDGGILEAYLETDAAKKESARDALRSMLDELCRNGISGEELQDAKNVAKTDFMRENELKAARAGTLAFFEDAGLGAEFFDALFSEVDALSLDEVNSVVREMLAPEKALEVIVGPNPGGGGDPELFLRAPAGQFFGPPGGVFHRQQDLFIGAAQIGCDLGLRRHPAGTHLHMA